MPTRNRKAENAAARSVPFRPRLEILEDRTVPATVVTDFPGAGLYRYDPASHAWQLLTGVDPAALAVDGNSGTIIASFKGYGTYQWTTSSGWQLLTGATASEVAVAGFGQNVVGEFQGAGLWEYHPDTGWFQLTAANASSVSVDNADNVAGVFPGAGVWGLPGAGGGWIQLTAANASQVVCGGTGYVVAEIPGAGVWDFHFGAGWTRITAADAVSLAGSSAGGLVVGSFATYGTFTINPVTRETLFVTGAIADDLATDGVNVVGAFGGGGTWYYSGASPQWEQIHPLDAVLGLGGEF
jgi:hypothetical protein